MSTPLRVLIVEDDPRDAALLVRELERGGYELTTIRVDTPEAMADAIEKQTWDVVISDYAMPRFSAQAALALVKNSGIDLPFIVVSGTVGEETAVEAMRAGAHDFMPKDKFARLRPAIARELREAAGRAEHRAMERQFAQAQKMEAVGQLTGGVAHDFNNLLTVIMGNLELLEFSLKGRPEDIASLQAALGATLRGAELTRQLLAFSRRQALEPRIVRINKLVKGMTRLLSRTIGENVEISRKTSPDLWPVLVDPTQLESALVNLAVNARDAMPNGGKLTIETANAPLDESYAAQYAEVTAGDYVALSVSDTGIGMPPEIVARVFEPFFTTKEIGKGTGLGMSMVFGFVKQSLGHIKVYSEVGHGTTVRLYLPRAQVQGDAKAQPAPAETPSMAQSGEVILLVEDDASVRKIAMQNLARFGYQVLDAVDGPTALAVLDRSGRIDLLFTDLIMPGGMDGTELADRARQRRPGLKILFTSGYTEPALASKMLRIDGAAVLPKPYRIADLGRKVREVLDRMGGH
ncbi:MAG: response regulator [Proteobacteria bacterium]|nr:response regulator [Pseudomonadota bacterium]